MNKMYHNRRSIRFRQLSRKAYAAFCSLGREVTIGRVAHAVANLEMRKAGRHVAVVAMVCASQVALAEESGVADPGDLTSEVLAQSTPVATHKGDSTYRQLSLQEVLVVSQKAEVESTNHRLVTVISKDRIQAMPVQTVSDVLKYMPGVDIRTRGANGAQSDVSMRGGTFDQVLVMLNGINLTDAHTGHYSMNLPIPTIMMDKVEVLEGTGTKLFGLNAFAGAINVTTPKPEPLSKGQQSLHMAGKLSAGMYGYVHPELGIQVQRGAWYLNGAAEYSRADGYNAPQAADKEQEALKNTDFKLANIYLQTGYKGLDVQIGAQYKDAGAGMFYGSSTDQFDATRTAFASANYAYQWGKWGLDAQASYRANYDRYEWHRGQRLYGNFHFSQTTVANIKGHYASPIGTSTVGVEVRNENIHSTNLGDTINPDGQVPNVAGFNLGDVRVLDLVKGKNRLNLNYFAEQTFCWQDVSASVGVSGNWNTMFGNNIAGGANIGYRYAPQGTVYINANRSLRLPTFTDLYYKAGQQRGNRDLQPEKAWVVSVGTKYSKGLGNLRPDGQRTGGTISVAADWYYRWGRDIIDWVYDESDQLYHAQNWNRVNATGLEVGVNYHLNDWLRDVRVQYAYTWLDVDMSKTVSSYLDYLSHKLIIGIDHGIWNGMIHGQKMVIGANWSLRWQKREGQFKNVAGQTESYQPVCLLDGAVYAEYNMVRVAAECTNMTNRHYYDYGGVLQPGAWAKMSIQFRL